MDEIPRYTDEELEALRTQRRLARPDRDWPDGPTVWDRIAQDIKDGSFDPRRIKLIST